MPSANRSPTIWCPPASASSGCRATPTISSDTGRSSRPAFNRRSTAAPEVRAMLRLILPLPLLLLTAAAEEIPFEPEPATFADPAACREHLAIMVKVARGEGYDAVE